MVRTWKITATKKIELDLQATSLDEVTRQLPDGYYSTFRTYDHGRRVIGLSAHLRRLPHADASSLRRSASINLRTSLLLLLGSYRPREARIRVLETKGGEFYISIEPLKLLPREVYENGVRVETMSLYRNDPRTKSTAFISASDAERKHIAQVGIFEALLVKNGRILEGMTSNFFYVLRAERASTALVAKNAPRSAQRGVLLTAHRGILPGVTRTMVIRAARGRGVEVRYRALKLDQLPAVKEAFITSSTRGIVPVIQIDQIKVGQGRVGALTQKLMSAYAEDVLKNSEEI